MNRNVEPWLKVSRRVEEQSFQLIGMISKKKISRVRIEWSLRKAKNGANLKYDDYVSSYEKITVK